MEGRNTPSRGLDTTAKFIAVMLERWGVKPAGDEGTYFQKISLSATKVVPESSSATINGRPLKYGDDFTVMNTSLTGSAMGSVVYGGDGWMVKARNTDALKGLDVKGKIVVVFLAQRGQGALNGTAGQDWADPIANAKSKGAVGLIYVTSSTFNPGGFQGRGGNQPRYSVDRFSTGGGEQGLPVILLRPDAAATLFAGEKMEWADVAKAASSGAPPAGFELRPDKRFTFAATVETLKATSQNVVGVIEGSDPVLKKEYVGLSAHYDHLGTTDTPVNGDRVYNGADDDGSGTTAVLAIAEAFSHANHRPKRSMLFIWHVGEEKGLWGSRYFTMFPEVPLKQVTSLINIDMIGRSKADGDTNPANRNLTGPNGIYVIGATMMSTELDKLTRRVNDKYLHLTYDFKYDDPKDTNRFFYRSDHINYARQGIPILFFFDGVHEDYHRLGDEVSKIDFNKMEHVARTIYQTLWELASLKDRPVVDKPKPAQLQ
jgi:hypothetical protein